MRGLDGTQSTAEPFPFLWSISSFESCSSGAGSIVFHGTKTKPQRSLQTTLLICGETLWLLISEY